MKKHHSGQNPLERKDGSGRPRKTKPIEDRLLVKHFRKNPFQAVPSLIRDNREIKVGRRTIERRLHEVLFLFGWANLHMCSPLQAGVRSFRAAKAPRLTILQALRRVRWCRNWRKFDFKTVVFSDEKRFCLMGDGPTRVWRRKGECFLQKFMCPTTKFKGSSVMVWGCISYNGPGYALLLYLHKHGLSLGWSSDSLL